MANDENKQSFLSANAGSIIGGLSTIGGWLGIGEGRQDRRQIKQQGKLNELNAQTSKQLADYEQMLKMKMWKDTNYGAQLAEAEKAGVSKAAAIGGSGTGTQGASVSGVGGGSAADAASTTNARTAQMQAGMQLASQLALQKAQKENIEADTENKKAEATGTGVDTEGKKIDVDIKNKTKGDQIQIIQETASKALAEAVIAQQKQVINEETMQDQIKQIQQETINKIKTNDNLSIENKIKTAEQQIKLFEAEMTKKGISPNAPWWTKYISDVYEDIKEGMKKVPKVADKINKLGWDKKNK